MPTTTLTPTVTAAFPSGASYTLDEFANAFAARLQFTLPSSSVIYGQLGGTEPLSALSGNGATPGLWFNSNIFYQWNADGSKYLPIPVAAGQLVNGTIYKTEIQTSNVSSNTILVAPADKSGTIALVGDIQTLNGTSTLTGTSVTVDCSAKKNAYLVMSGNSTVNLSGLIDGQIQYVIVENASLASDWTVTWTLQSATGILAWPGATAPTQSVHQTTKRVIDVYKFIQCGTITIGNRDITNAQIASSGAGSDVTPPTVTSLDGISNTNKIYVSFSELLTSGTIPAGDFTVRKGGVAQTVSSAVASGSLITITLSTTYKASNTVTVQYAGSDIKDVASNVAAAFGPSSVTISSGGGTGGGGNNASQ